MPFSGRRGEIPSGARFLLDPSPGEFAGYFRGFDGAAFYATAEHISFGAAKDGSIDHDAVADAFALGNDETFRGWINLDTRLAHIETWVDAAELGEISEQERQKLEANLIAAKGNIVLGRLAAGFRHLVFSYDSGAPIIDSHS